MDGTTVAVFVKDISGSGMRLWLPYPMPCGMKVEVCAGGITSFGEIVRCETNPDGSAMLGIKIFESGATGASLGRLNDALKPEPVYERLSSVK
jgi:hypothetical protein